MFLVIPAGSVPADIFRPGIIITEFSQVKHALECIAAFALKNAVDIRKPGMDGKFKLFFRGINMSVADSTLDSGGRLPKVISPKVHGIIDYAHVAFFFSLALLCRKSNKPAALAAFGTGAFVLVQSLLTDYPLGLKPVIPFATHGKMDAGFASASWVIPRVFGFKGTAAAKVFEVNSAVEGSVVRMTDFNSERARIARMRD